MPRQGVAVPIGQGHCPRIASPSARGAPAELNTDPCLDRPRRFGTRCLMGRKNLSVDQPARNRRLAGAPFIERLAAASLERPCRLRGWSRDGVPTPPSPRRLGLERVLIVGGQA